MTTRPDRPTRPGLRLLARLLVVLGAVLVPGVVLAQAAGAHAVLVSSSPVDGARVNREPAEVRLTFDEEVGLIPGAEQVISTTGLRAGTGHVRPPFRSSTKTTGSDGDTGTSG